MSRENLQLKWVKTPQQDRSRDTQARFARAAKRLMARGKSFDAITVADLVKEADSSVGAFYARFRDKTALLHVLQIELYKEGVATAEDGLKAAVAAKSSEAVARGFVTLAISTYRQHEGLRRALFVQMCNDKELRARATALARETCASLVKLLESRFPDAPAERTRTVADVGHRIVYAVLDQRMMFGNETPTGREIDDKTLGDELAVAINGYVQAQLG
jgi:AcrR family transcriptional regulator